MDGHSEESTRPPVLLTLLQSVAVGFGCLAVAAAVVFVVELAIRWQQVGFELIDIKWLLAGVVFRLDICIALFSIGSASYVVSRWAPARFSIALVGVAGITAIVVFFNVDALDVPRNHKSWLLQWQQLDVLFLLTAPPWLLAFFFMARRFLDRQTDEM